MRARVKFFLSLLHTILIIPNIFPIIKQNKTKQNIFQKKKTVYFMSQGDSLCRVPRKVDKSMDHIVSGCSKLAQNEYKRRHDNLAKIVHSKLARKCNFEAGGKWYEHEPESVLENDYCNILWDFFIQTDHVIEVRRPDLVVVDKKERSCEIIDFAVPGNSRIEEKERDKIKKY